MYDWHVTYKYTIKKHDRNAKLILFAKKVGRIRQRIRSHNVEVFWRWCTTCNYLKGVCVQTLHEKPSSPIQKPWRRVGGTDSSSGVDEEFLCHAECYRTSEKVCYLRLCPNPSCSNAVLLHTWNALGDRESTVKWIFCKRTSAINFLEGAMVIQILKKTWKKIEINLETF